MPFLEKASVALPDPPLLVLCRNQHGRCLVKRSAGSSPSNSCHLTAPTGTCEDSACRQLGSPSWRLCLPRWSLGPVQPGQPQPPVRKCAQLLQLRDFPAAPGGETWKGGTCQEETTNIKPTAEAQGTSCAGLQGLAGSRGQGTGIGMAWQGSVPPGRMVAWRVAPTSPHPHTWARPGQARERSLGKLGCGLCRLGGQETWLGPWSWRGCWWSGPGWVAVGSERV